MNHCFKYLFENNPIFHKKYFWGIVILIGIIIKIVLLPTVKLCDYQYFLEPWVNYIKTNGYFSSLKDPFHNYTPTYIYFLVIVAKTGLVPLFPIKILSIIFEYLLAFFIGKILYLNYKNKIVIWSAMAIVPLIPTVVLNSSYWAQCDAIYSAFVIGSIYFILDKKFWISMLFFGIAFSIKMQAVMLLPFFFVMLLRGNIKWYYFLLIPILYFISIIPAWIAGRPLFDLLTIYLQQAEDTAIVHKLSQQFPNLYIWFNNDHYDLIVPIGIFATILITFVTGILLSNKKYIFTFETWIRLAFSSAIIVPFLLPGMHERYMFLGDVLGILYFFVAPKKFYLPLGIILVSFYSYIRCSRFIDILSEKPSFFIYLIIIILVFIDFIKHLKTIQKC